MDNKRTVKVPMMKLKFLSTPYFRDEELSCTVVELKYTGNASALFILPDEGRMQQVEASLQPETLRKWRDSLSTRCVSAGSRGGLAPYVAVGLGPSVPIPHSLTGTECNGQRISRASWS